MRRLVLGCGYLGLRVARLWKGAGDEVFALTRSAEHAATFEQEGISAVRGDVTDRSSLAALPDVDTVVWAVGLDRAAGHTQHAVYVDGLKNAFDALRGRARRWLLVSSTSVYGQTDGSWVDETSPCEPKQPNGRVCLEAEQTFWREVELQPAVAGHVLRFAGIYGPGRLLQRVAALKSGIVLSGKPDAWLNLIHVDDGAKVVALAAETAEPSSTWLVVDDHPLVRRDYYVRLAELVGAPIPEFEQLPQLASQSGDRNKRCSNRRVREVLRAELRYPTFELGLPNAVSRSESALP